MNPPSLAAELTFLSGSFKGRRVPLRGQTVVLGRDAACDVMLDDESASRKHAQITFQEGRLRARDLGSTNGTYINDARVEEQELHNGDRFAVGNTVFLVELYQPGLPVPPTVVISEQQRGVMTRLTMSLDETRFLELKEGLSLHDTQRQLERLYAFISLVSGVLHRPALLERSLEYLLDAFRADRGAILLLEADGAPGKQVSRTRAGLAAAGGIEISRSLLQHMLQRKHSFISEDVEKQEGAAEPPKAPSRTILGVPLKLKDRLVGVLYLDKAGGETPFTEGDLKLCTAMAMQLAICLENTGLYGELLDAAEFNNSILRSMAGGVLVVDLQGRVTHANRAALETLRQDESALLHRRLSSVKSLEPLAEVILSTLETGRTEDRYEVNLEVGGETLPLGLTSALLTNHTGAKVGVVASFRSLASLRRLEEQLRRTQHLAALGQMAAGVAHEIRNPLNSVRGFSQLITEKAAQDCAGKGPCAEYGRIIVEEVDRMNRIIQDLLDYSRQRELTLVSLQVDQVLMEVVKEMEPQFRTAQVALRLDLPEATVPAVMGNEDKLHQVFRNILLNALQASKEGSEVAARVHVAPAAGAKDGGRREIAVEVEDRGEGIPAAYLTRIFDPVFTLKDVGTGLGLSISQQIMDQHGGRIEVKSREGNGSTFAVCLPVPPSDGRPPAPVAPATPAAPA